MIAVRVDLGERSYPIHIGAGLLRDQAALLPFLAQPKVAVVTNPVVADLYLDQLSRGLDAHGVDVVSIVVPDGE